MSATTRRAALLVLAALLFITAAGCATTRGGKRADDGATPLTPEQISLAHSYFPLAVGMKWTYKVERQGADITWERSIVKQEGEYFLDSDGARYQKDKLGVRDQNRYFIRAGAGEGFTWWAQMDALHKQHLKVLSTDMKIKVPAGVFEGCLAIEITMPMPDGNQWIERMVFARDTGMIKRVQYQRTADGKMHLQEKAELVEFTKP